MIEGTASSWDHAIDTLASRSWSDWSSKLSRSPAPWHVMLRLPWRGSREDPDTKLLHDQAMLAAMAGIAPRDPVEGMLAAQMVAVHEASMECFRRAALPEQTFAGRELGLKYGDKLARTYAALVETLDRHRGKGQPGGPGRARDGPGRRPGDRRRRHPGGGGQQAKARINPMHGALGPCT